MPDRPAVEDKEARAYYRPAIDLVNVPAIRYFESGEEYYSTLFHELAHSTGHAKRLNREGVNEVAAFGTAIYSKEELIAETLSISFPTVLAQANPARKVRIVMVSRWTGAVANNALNPENRIMRTR